MKNNFLLIALLAVALTACAPDQGRRESRPNISPNGSEEKKITTVFADPSILLKSTKNQRVRNQISVVLNSSKNDSYYYFPFYFNSENYTFALVTRPIVQTFSCEASQAGPLGMNFILGSPEEGFPIFGFDPGHNPGEPTITAGYDIEERIGNSQSENTITIMFFISGACEKVEIEFEAKFR